MSKPYLDGASIDFADSIDRQGFTIDHPNAVAVVFFPSGPSPELEQATRETAKTAASRPRSILCRMPFP